MVIKIAEYIIVNLLDYQILVCSHKVVRTVRRKKVDILLSYLFTYNLLSSTNL